jgi:type IV secretory pathway component VirB8
MTILKKNKIDKKNNQDQNLVDCKDKDYFTSAQGWHYDRYESQLIQANRWLLAFWIQIGISSLLVLSLVVLLPLKTLVPLVIRQNTQTHEVFVDKVDHDYLPHQNEVESDLVRYVILRETYSSVDLALRYKQVLLETNKACAIEYQKTQANTHSESPVNIYGADGTRAIHVEDVVFLTNKNMKGRGNETATNLAKVDFISTDTIHNQTVQKYWVATIAWEYQGTPQDKDAAWHNWNGFTITYYRVDQRNVEKKQ